MNRSVVVGNGAGFWGDWLAAPQSLLADPRLEVLTLEYLAELTLSILARQRQKDPQGGYVTDLPRLMPQLAPWLAQDSQRRVITNAGGVNPLGCVQAVAGVLVQQGLGELPLGVVWGDDLLPRWEQLRSQGWQAPHADSGEPFPQQRQVVCAHAYLGAGPLVECLNQGARVVITGRVADASLTVAAARWRFGWTETDWDLLAGAAVAGHLIECGAQLTGGYSQWWKQTDLALVGYPLAILSEDGSAVLTKPPGTGGTINRHIVAEQMLYEVEDPSQYITPDVTVNFTTVELEELGPEEVRVQGATGSPPPENYKVALAYADGFFASCYLVIYGDRVEQKAQYCAQLVRKRLEHMGRLPQRFHWELLGTGAAVPGQKVQCQGRELVLRMAVHDSDPQKVEAFARVVPSLVTSGPSGIAGYTEARAQLRPVFAHWPTCVPRHLVQPHWEVRPAAQWLK